MKRSTTLITIFSMILCAFSQLAYAAELEKVRMQLRWHHQYQFAGYYAAKHKGYYEQAGFDVEIVAGDPNRQPVSEVLAGRADFAEGNSEVLIYQLQGEPLVALAAIFQHSPSALLTLADANITRAEQLINKKVMLMGNGDDADLIAMFRAAGLKEHQVDIQPSSYQLDDLITGYTDAFNAYATNEPYYLQEQGIKYNLIYPRDYGIDFYSDILFTSEARAKQDPDSVQRFKEASIKGWQYALSHTEEVIQIIYQHYNQNKSYNHMRFEALTVNSLVHSELLPIGHMFPKRLEKMADAFIEQNMVIDKDRLEQFIFKAPERMNNKAYTWLVSAGCITFVAIIILAVLLRMNCKLRKEIQQRLIAEEQLKQLADTDGLTQLLNRRAFIHIFNEHKNLAERYKQIFSLILFDLDWFKKINDTYGHDIGDKVLIETADILKNTLREVDIAARFGGEEFIVLLPNTSLSQAVNSATRIKENIANNIFTTIKTNNIHVTASFGVCQWQGEPLNELLIKVDKALYQAKENGRDQIATSDTNNN